LKNIRNLPVLLLAALTSVGCCSCGSTNHAVRSSVSSTVLLAPSTESSKSGIANDTSTSTTETDSKGRGDEGVGAISKYGHPAQGPEKRAITALVRAYYVAAAADDGAKACSLLYSLLEEAVPENYGQPPGPPSLRGKTCATVLIKLFKQVPNQSSSVLAKTEVTGVRVRGRVGFAQLRSSGMPMGQISVEREHQSWKVSSLIGSSCTKCASHEMGHL
jgi:hypothetical protein